jgi:hypothetical protein
MSLVQWTFVALAAASMAATQRPIPPPPAQPGPPPRSDVRPREVAVTVEGCVEGRRLKLPYKGAYQGVHEEALRASEFLLEGPRELLRMLASDHKDHHEQIAGIAIIPPSPSGETVDTRTRQIGPARVSGGVRQTGRQGVPPAATPADAARPIRLRVQSITHLGDTCVARRQAP